MKRIIGLIQRILADKDRNEQVDLDGIRCTVCTNYFFVVDGAIELPAYCCYCGTKFTGTEVVNSEDFKKGQTGTN
jgi:hypothetical protein